VRHGVGFVSLNSKVGMRTWSQGRIFLEGSLMKS